MDVGERGGLSGGKGKLPNQAFQKLRFLLKDHLRGVCVMKNKIITPQIGHLC